MSALPVKYGRHVPVQAQTPCDACEKTTSRPVADHCHAHGWIRATLCRSCNIRMALIDQRITPRGNLTETLIAIAGRCPDCTPIAISDLAPPAALRSPGYKEALASDPGPIASVAAGRNLLADSMFTGMITVNEFITGRRSIRDVGLVRCAADLPWATVWGEEAYQTDWEKSAALLLAVARDKPFTDANMKTAWLSAMALLEVTDHPSSLDPDQQAVVDLMFAVSRGELYDVNVIAGELVKFTR